MKLRFALAAATCLALPVAAHAQPITGPYVNLEGGSGILFPVTYSDSLAGTSGKELYKSSYNFLVGAGFGFGNGFRIELDGDDLHFTDSKADSGGFQTRVSGPHTIFGPMINVLYDIPVQAPVAPYIGAGGGYQWVQASSFYQNTSHGALAYSDTKGSPAFDVVAGIAYEVPQVPGLAVTLEDRFTMLTDNINQEDTIRGGYPKGSPYGGTLTFQSQSVDSVFLGIRYALFTAPPAPPPVAPPVAPPMAAPKPAPRTYLVFFDWDKYSLTPRALDIISEAATASKTGTTELDVSGYTDTSGTPTYNQGLSLRRAKAVEGQLVADGVPASEIDIHAYGETHLLVPTGPGVREPQNRRVEIVLK
jgi:opacity protein-like surface antigen